MFLKMRCLSFLGNGNGEEKENDFDLQVFLPAASACAKLTVSPKMIFFPSGGKRKKPSDHGFRSFQTIFF